MTEQRTPEEQTARLAKLRILPAIIGVVGLGLILTGIDPVIGFGLFGAGIALFFGWGAVTSKILEAQAKQDAQNKD